MDKGDKDPKKDILEVEKKELACFRPEGPWEGIWARLWSRSRISEKRILGNSAKMSVGILETLTWTFQIISSSEESTYNFWTSKVKKIEEEHMIR